MKNKNKNSASKTLEICSALRANKNNFCEKIIFGNQKRKDNLKSKGKFSSFLPRKQS